VQTVSRDRRDLIVPWERLGALVATSLAIMGTPGPATISLTATGSAYGIRRSLAYLAGIVAGTVAVLLAVASGITAALLALPAVRPGLVAAAVAYILWLAYHIATAPPLSEAVAGAQPPGLTGGALLGIANPKAWVAIAAVFAGSRLAGGDVLDASAKVGVLTLMIVLINGTWLAAGASLAPLLRDPSRARIVNVALAAVLVVAAGLAVLR
jgi:threonine/homoserine/homoserine lactone efflux protein